MADSSKKVVLITGGAMGQGRTHAIAFAEANYNVVLLDMLDPEAPAFKETIGAVENAGATALAIKTNITSTPEMEAAFAQAWDTLVALTSLLPTQASSTLVTPGNLPIIRLKRLSLLTLKAPGAPTNTPQCICVNKVMVASSIFLLFQA